MSRSYFRPIVTLVASILSGASVLLQATEHFNYHAYRNRNNPYSLEDKAWMLPNNPYSLEDKAWMLPNNPYLKQKFIQPRSKKEGDQPLAMVQYQAEDAIVFDAKKNTLSLHGTSVLAYDKMKLEANAIVLNLNAHTITAEGTKDQHNTSIENPIVTYTEVTKNKYGKDDSNQTHTFFTEKIHYNINTKRALVHKLLTKQKESIIKSEEVKKEDEETFYARDLKYTTCLLAHPHFYIQAKQAKMVQDKQITSGPFRFYFDDVPTPLGFVFGTLFLEGKRTHGIIPPDIGEEETNGFYLRNGGYYMNFNDYADISILGSIYANGVTELKNQLRFKKRYVCSGDMGYTQNRGEKTNGWSFTFTLKNLTHSARSLNANIKLHNKEHNIIDKEKKDKKAENESSGTISYKEKLVDFPYTLVASAKYRQNLVSKFTHWTLPEGNLNASWYPFRRGQSSGTPDWFNAIRLQHTINFENHLQNAKKDPVTSPLASVKWNKYIENGILHNLPLSTQCKLFEYVNVNPTFTYDEAWYWKKLHFEEGEPEPIQVPGFHRVYSWSFGGRVDTMLHHTQYFNDKKFIEGLRIKTEPSATFTYTPDFSKEKYGYFQEVTYDNQKKEKKYLFEGLRPQKTLTNRATSILACKLQNTVELKVKKDINPDEKKPKKNSRKVFLFKNLDFEAKYDFKAEKCHLTDGIDTHIATEIKMGEMGKVGFDLTTTFDPYLSKLVDSENGQVKEEQIDVFAWDHGQYLGKVKKCRCKIGMDFESNYNLSQKEKKKKALLGDSSGFTNQIDEKEHKIDFKKPWSLGWEFNWIYDRLYTYQKEEQNSKTEKYITFNGSVTLVKKWKLSGHGTYDFVKSKMDPSATEISIQRDLHCWQLSYQWHPLGDQPKYDFSLGVKANVLKALKLPRKRTYNKLQ